MIDASQFRTGWDRLTGLQQRLLRLRCQGREYEDIAAEVDLDPKVVKKQLKYTHGKLQRARVGAYGRSQSAGVCYVLGYVTASNKARKAA
jgi:DNA-binding CsgD family transcriptional regulator